MNWTDKANEIADGIYAKLSAVSADGCKREEIVACLRDAALKGMAFECDNWLLKRTK